MKGYVTRKQAIQLKSLGFNESCVTYYHLNKEFGSVGKFKKNKELLKGEFSAPTLEQALAWFIKKNKYCYFYPAVAPSSNIFTAYIVTESELPNNKILIEPRKIYDIKGYHKTQNVCLDYMLFPNKRHKF